MKATVFTAMGIATLISLAGCLTTPTDDYREPNEPKPQEIPTGAPKAETPEVTNKDFEELLPDGPGNITDETNLENVQQLSPDETKEPDYKDGPVLSE